MIYKIMPRVRVRWHDVWLGALVTAALFTIGKFLIGLYIGKSGVASGYGAAGSIVIVLVWVYYSAQIFLLGAEFTWVYARTYGSMSGVPQSTPTHDALDADAGRNPWTTASAPAVVAVSDTLQPDLKLKKEPVARIAAGFGLVLLGRYLLRHGRR